MAGLDRALVKGAAAGAEPHHADVAGNEAHQQKHERRRPDERRNHQQQSLYDVPIHGLALTRRAERGTLSRNAGEGL